MNASVAPTKREQSRGEELANGISHIVGLLLAVVGIPFLILDASATSDPAVITGVILFSFSIIFLYLSSTTYHLMNPGKAKLVLRRIEHSAIFVLIAGTYSPFTLGVLRGSWGWTLFILVWTLGIVGVVLKSSNRLFHPHLSNAMFLLMGWLILVAVKPMLELVPPAGLWLLLAGGLAYSIGVIFYAASGRFHYAHFIWHLFVMAGTIFHYFAVLWYAY